MPNVSRETASERVTTDGLDVRLEHLDGGYSRGSREIVEFRPTEILARTIPVVPTNLQASGLEVEAGR